jgi:hypothetical protein
MQPSYERVLLMFFVICTLSLAFQLSKRNKTIEEYMQFHQHDCASLKKYCEFAQGELCSSSPGY